MLPSLIVVNVWKEFPFAMLLMLAGLQTVPEQLLRAAWVDGAGAWQRFWHVTMPHLKGVTLITVLLLFVSNLNHFTIPWVMTGGGPAGASDIWITAIYPAGVRADPLRHRLGLFGDPVRGDDRGRLSLRARARLQ